MNLYLIEQTDVGGYDTYSDAVVAAPDEATAKDTYPGMYWDAVEVTLLSTPGRRKLYDWPETVESVTATLIGVAVEGTPHSVICASYHAG